MEQHKAECLEKWQALELDARRKWGEYRRKQISRRQLESWLSQHSERDQQTLRNMYNKMRK